MSQAAPRLEPDQDALRLADHMTSRDDIMGTILEETLSSAERGHLLESGRTACGHPMRLQLPLNRFPQAVDLAECPPVQATGVWHTHATREQLLDGEHSLPDWGNIVFHGVDASLVVGVNTSELVVAGDDPIAMAERFRNVLGLEDVRTSRGVSQALRRGEIANPPAVRRRLRKEMGPLVRRVSTALPAGNRFRDRVRQVPAERQLLAAHPRPRRPGLVAEQLDIGPDLGRMRQNTRDAADQLNVALRRVIAEGGNQALGIIIGTIISQRILGQSV